MQVEDSLDNAKYCKDLCQALVEAGIPLNAISHPAIRGFLKHYTKRPTPTRDILNYYFEKEAIAEQEAMQTALKDKMIYVSFDETTDSHGRYIICVLAGELNKEEATSPFLILCEELEKVNNITISQVI